LPSEIVSAYRTGDLVVFAGAGVGTESRGVYPSSFYEWIKYGELKLPEEKQISFSNLMSFYCSHPRTRKDLLLAIKKRIDYVRAFPELYNFATRFHQELSTIPHLDEIFTTNWDDFFERECYATPVVTGQDFAVFQDTPGRKVFKLHGSIYNYGSIVATKEDYEKCYRRLSKGIIGAKFKMLLMSKTLIFFGFSFDDEDFQRLYRLLKKEVGGLIPHFYVVTLDEQAKDKLDSLDITATPIITSAVFFVKQLKKKLIEDKLMLPDQQYSGIYEKLADVYIEHEKLSKMSLAQHPDLLYSFMYQDGLKHAFERLLATKNSGEYSCSQHVIDVIASYENSIKERLHEGNYIDVAYLVGYLSGLAYFLSNNKNRRLMPLYFAFRCKTNIMNIEHFIKLEKRIATMHKSAHRMAEKRTSQVSEDIAVHHTPFV
jgi:NAD-dependent SIR2 family protein deacetylase